MPNNIYNKDLNFNNGLKNLEPNYNFQVPEGIKRMHFNELDKPILPIKILTKGITSNLNYYPEKKYNELEEIASRFYGVATNKIVCTNGSDEGIDLCVRTFCNPNDNICVLQPGFGSYEQSGKGFLCNIFYFYLQNDNKKWFLDSKKLIEFCKQNEIKLLFLSNPLAHVGNVICKTDLLKIIENLPKTMIVIDEAYIEFTKEESSIKLLEKYYNISVLRTTSKFFGLAGIRLGFIFTNYREEVFKIKLLDNVNFLTCQIGINLFKNLNDEIIKNRQIKTENKKKKIIKFLQQFDEVDTIYESKTNFLYIKLNCSGEEFAKKMINDFRIKIRYFNGKFKNYCRVSCL